MSDTVPAKLNTLTKLFPTSKITNPITAGIRTSDITKFLFGTTSFVVIIYVTDIIRPNIMAENKVAQAEINVIDVPSITV